MAMQSCAVAFPGAGTVFHMPVRLSRAPVRQVMRPTLGFGTKQLRQREGLQCPGECRKRVVIQAAAGSDTAKKFQTTVEIDKLIDTLRTTSYENIPQVVAENVLGFNTDFWLRLAARADLSTSATEKRKFEELATTIMHIVQLLVQKTQEKIESSTDILESILMPIVESSGEITWPPSEQERIKEMRKEVILREEAGDLDESFLSQVSAQMRQAREAGDKPGLVAMLQKVLQLYCSTVLSKRTYATKGKEVDKAEELLEKLIFGDEENWNEDLRTGLKFGGGEVESDELSRVAEKRVERTLMRTESGSYQQRLLVEYVKEIQTRAKLVAEAFSSQSS